MRQVTTYLEFTSDCFNAINDEHATRELEIIIEKRATKAAAAATTTRYLIRISENGVRTNEIIDESEQRYRRILSDDENNTSRLLLLLFTRQYRRHVKNCGYVTLRLRTDERTNGNL